MIFRRGSLRQSRMSPHSRATTGRLGINRFAGNDVLNKVFVLVLVLCSLAGGATRPTSAALVPDGEANPWRSVTIYVTPTQSEAADGVGFGRGRAEQTRYLP